MPRQKVSDQVALIRKQQQNLANKLKEVEAKERQAAKEETRRKNEIAGALAMKEFEANPSGKFAVALLGLLNQGVMRATERELFDLAPLAKNATTKPPSVEAASPG